jgi:integrase
MVADVLALYAQEVAPKHARPAETAGRIERLGAWWRGKRLSDVNGRNCRLYASERGSLQAARRELEDLRAAIKYHRKEGLCREIVEVVLPEKSQSRQRWLTRSEVAKLIWTAWRSTDFMAGRDTTRRTHQHIARFILLAVYTGSRAGTVCGASFTPRDGFGWIDCARGVFYRRPDDERETRKRKPPIRLPGSLLAHLRRWERMGMAYPVEFYARPVVQVNAGFARIAEEAGMPDVTPHTLRHTAATWLMQSGADKWEAAGYLGMTLEVLERVYGHMHTDHLKSAVEGIGRRRKT